MKKTCFKRAFSVFVFVFVAMIFAFVSTGIIEVSAITVKSGSCGDNLVWQLDANGNLTITGTGPMTNYSSTGPWGTGVKGVIIDDGATSIGKRAFWNCRELENVVIGKSVTKIDDNAFDSCVKLKSVTLPSGLSYIGNYAFFFITSITIPQSVTHIGFRSFNSFFLESIEVEEGNTVYHSNSNSLIETKTKTLICGCKNSIIPSDGSVTCIGDYAFFQSKMSSISIPGSVTTIGKYAFHSSSLTSASIGDGVLSIGENAFSVCTSLTNVMIPSSVINIGNWAFDGCSNLTSVIIPESVVTIGSYVFNECYKLTLSVVKDSYAHFYATENGINYRLIGDGSCIVVTNLPEKLSYLEGFETLDLSGGEITVYYDDGATETVNISIDMVSGFDNSVVGEQVLTVTYGGLTDTFEVEVVPKSVSRIAVTRLPDKTSYLEAKETLDVSGGEVTVYYDNNTSEIVGLIAEMVAGFNNRIPGNNVLTVVYHEHEATFSVTIVAKTLVRVVATCLPDKTIYLEGEEFDPTGLEVTAYYDNDTEEIITDYDIFGYYSTPGERTVTVAYCGKYYSFGAIILMQGDADGDGVITVGDALIALRIAAKLVSPTDEKIAVCDTDGDGEITVADALAILRVAAKLAPSL